MKIEIMSGGVTPYIEIAYESFTFSGGEEHIRLINIGRDPVAEEIAITVNLDSSKKVMLLALAVDALRRAFAESIKITLIAPYFPYARQDRVCSDGESLGCSVMASMINAMDFDKVFIWDAHSDVSVALLNNCKNVKPEFTIERHTNLKDRLIAGELTLIAPDAGASKKVNQVSKYFNGACEVIQAEKIRDLKTGNITGTGVFGDVEGKDCLIVDDICDGGRTFIELAKVLQVKGSNRIELYVTHGIFSKGREVFDGLIDEIHTSPSLTNELGE